MRGGSRWAWLLPVLVATAVTVWRYDAKPLWRDEFYTLATAARSYPVMLRGLQVTDAGMGPWYALMRPWVLVSQAEGWLRLPGVVATVLAAGLVGLIAHRLAAAVAGAGTAVVAGAAAGVLLPVVPLVVRHAQEARPYPVILACVAALAHGLLRDREDPRARWLVLWVAAGTAASALHVITGAPVTVALIGAAWLFPGCARRRRILAGGVLPVATAVGMVAVGLSQSPGRVAAGFPLAEKTLGLWQFYGANLPAFTATAVLAAAGVVFLRRETAGLVLVVTWLVAPVAAVVLSAVAGQLFEARYTIAAAPALAVLAGLGIAATTAWLPARRRTVAAALVVALLVAVQAPRLVRFRLQPFYVDDVPTAAAAVAARARPGDAVVHLGNTDRPMLRHHLPAAVALDDVLLVRDPAVSVSIGGDDLPEDERASALAGRTRVWLVGTEHTDTWAQRFPASVRAVRAGRVLVFAQSSGRFRVELWTAAHG